MTRNWIKDGLEKHSNEQKLTTSITNKEPIKAITEPAVQYKRYCLSDHISSLPLILIN